MYMYFNASSFDSVTNGTSIPNYKLSGAVSLTWDLVIASKGSFPYELLMAC